MGLGDKEDKGGVLFSSHHVKGAYYQRDLPMMTWTLIKWLK